MESQHGWSGAPAGEWAATRDGRRLRVERRGTRAPVVVFESGMGVSRHMWGAVVEQLGDDVSTVVYDRSGLGDSAPDPAQRTLDRLAADLVDVLDHLGDGPFVLVGHSWGGPIVRRAAERAPGRVAGLVLVDVTEETCDVFFSPASERQTRLALVLMPVAARTGLGRMAVRRLASMLPEESGAGMRSVDGTVAAVSTQCAELRRHVADLGGLLEAPPSLPEVPVTYISGMVSGRTERGRRPSLVAAHEAAAAAVPRGRHVRADRSSHHVPFTEPELVAAEIRRVLALRGPIVGSLRRGSS